METYRNLMICTAAASNLQSRAPGRNHGIALPIVLVALLLMSIVAVGLIRTVDTGNLVMGNLAFKQSASSAADIAAENAINYVKTRYAGTDLYSNRTQEGYYASSLNELDISGNSESTARALIDWDDNNCAYASGATYQTCLDPYDAGSVANGYEAKYLIARMCRTTGNPNGLSNNCARAINGSSAPPATKGEVSYRNNLRMTGASSPYFRIIVRVKGPRNTVSYTESYVHF